jgi:tRNA pseudouridine55 synthase
MPPFKIEKTQLGTPLVKDMGNYPDGIIISLDKPYGWTSSDAVRKIKFKAQRFFKEKNIKVGHAGTLDPLATGILLICLGKATKMAEQLQSQEKEYIAEITFGSTTPSFDLEKEIDHHYPYEHIDIESVRSIIPRFLGEIDQIPPVFSAKLIDGSRSYHLARAGIEKELKPSRVNIYELEPVSYDSPVLTLHVKCSKGTYIRSLARDFGTSLNSGAHLTALVRSSSGGFKVKNSISMDDLDKFMIIS